MEKIVLRESQLTELIKHCVRKVLKESYGSVLRTSIVDVQIYEIYSELGLDSREDLEKPLEELENKYGWGKWKDISIVATVDECYGGNDGPDAAAYLVYGEPVFDTNKRGLDQRDIKTVQKSVQFIKELSQISGVSEEDIQLKIAKIIEETSSDSLNDDGRYGPDEDEYMDRIRGL